jgi:hypothetical protein
MNAWLDDYFATAPKNIVKDGEENIVSFESGAYPQSKASSAASSYLDANYSLLSPVFGNYYFYDGSLYLREQAKASGYDNEYTVDSYYWFKVEPLKWNVLNSDGNSYFVTTEKVLNGKLAYHNNKSAQNVRYSDSSLKTSVEAMFDVTFRNVGTLIQLNSDERINAKLYPLSYSQYGSTASERICLPTDYARIFTTISSLSNGVQYWTNRIGYNNYDNKNYLIAITGNLSATTQDLAIAGVRPGMTITIE